MALLLSPRFQFLDSHLIQYFEYLLRNLHQHLETTILFIGSQVCILYALEKHDFKDLVDPIKKLKARHFENVAVMVNDFVN